VDPETGLPLIDVCHIVVFVNEDYPLDYQQVSIIDAVSSWFFTWSSARDTAAWNERKSEPIIYKVSSTKKMLEILHDNQYTPRKTVSYITSDPVAICIGPAWSSGLTGYNDSYERIYY
jgi:hypothetical protein